MVFALSFLSSWRRGGLALLMGAACWATFSPLLLAEDAKAKAFTDVIKLKSGETINCTILSETDKTITYKYMLTPKIPDIKTINKSDLQEPAEAAAPNQKPGDATLRWRN